jgi:hypothetical protein
MLAEVVRDRAFMAFGWVGINRDLWGHHSCINLIFVQNLLHAS